MPDAGHLLDLFTAWTAFLEYLGAVRDVVDEVLRVTAQPPS